jgi:phosphoheptose isomerase
MASVYELRDEPLPTAAPAPKYPSAPHALASTYCNGYFQELARAAASIDLAAVDRAANILLDAHAAGSTVFSCGNGGSASIANHMQCDHLKGIRTETDLRPRVLSLSSNVELLTAVANDIGYEEIFAYQLQSQSRPGDVLVAVSSSGRSPNIVQAVRWANNHGLRTIALTGFSGGDAKEAAEVAVHVDCTNYGVIEDLHQSVMHALAQYVRQSRMSADAIPLTIF